MFSEDLSNNIVASLIILTNLDYVIIKSLIYSLALFEPSLSLLQSPHIFIFIIILNHFQFLYIFSLSCRCINSNIKHSECYYTIGCTISVLQIALYHHYSSFLWSGINPDSCVQIQCKIDSTYSSLAVRVLFRPSVSSLHKPYHFPLFLSFILFIFIHPFKILCFPVFFLSVPSLYSVFL